MQRLVVFLGEQRTGYLERQGSDTWQFRLLSEYLELRSRPVLGQAFEDDPTRIHRATLRLPPFFSNLLPEGALRELLAVKAGVNAQREAFLLAALGEDLPGAVKVLAENGVSEANGQLDELVDSPASKADTALKFSLAGVQLKFSVIQEAGRLTVPAGGMGGDWIVKLPDRAYPGVPENEHSMLWWAEMSGLTVPERQLVRVASIQGLPKEVRTGEDLALAIRRFDRPEPGRRVHQEDFAQVLGLYPDDKYSRFNYETIARVVNAVAGVGALEALIRQLVFVVLSGNGDAHHKNWSLIYADGRSASLSPAYDLVFTRAYIEDDALALNLDGGRRFESISVESFRRLGRKVRVSEAWAAEVAEGAATRIREAFTEIEGSMRLDPEAKVRLRRHIGRLHI